MNRLVLAVLAVATLVAAVGWSQNPVMKHFMRRKLDPAHRVLDALAMEDYPAIVRHSQELSVLSLDASWQVFQTPDYVRHSDEFRRIADRMTDAGRRKDLSSAADAYSDLTRSCVRCHEHVRSVQAGLGG